MDFDWMDRSACGDMEAAVFFGDEVTLAKQVCAGCEVRTDCLDYALANSVGTGVWGGMTEPERLRERSRRRRKVRQ